MKQKQNLFYVKDTRAIHFYGYISTNKHIGTILGSC